MRSVFVLVTCAVLVGCGGPQSAWPTWPANGSIHVSVVRDDVHPTYQCEGEVQTRLATATFSCAGEGFDAWDVRGSAEQIVLPDVTRLWIHDADSANLTGQPEIAVDLEPHGTRYSGWATVILPDGTFAGHPGATAEAWVVTP
jgi:hypothetical protein